VKRVLKQFGLCGFIFWFIVSRGGDLHVCDDNAGREDDDEESEVDDYVVPAPSENEASTEDELQRPE
jgi:hypothetical protein